MLMYAIVLILVMLATNNPTVKNLFLKIVPGKKKEKAEDKKGVKKEGASK